MIRYNTTSVEMRASRLAARIGPVPIRCSHGPAQNHSKRGMFALAVN